MSRIDMPDLSESQRARFSAAIVRLDGDEETLIMLAGMVSEDAPTMLEQLRSDINSRQLNDAAQTGHALKGLLSTFETGTPVSDLQPLIDAARTGDLRTVSSLSKGLMTNLSQLIIEVRELSKNG